MQKPTESAPSAAKDSFAGLLASLTAARSAPAWNDDLLADDVTTLSYENALRTHARYRTLDPTDRSLTGPAPAGPVDSYELAPVEESPAAKPASPAAAAKLVTQPETEAAHRARVLFDRNLKSASITIRLSEEECAQLHRRAAEAGLTISAYLRSCTFETENLRALVKDTMAQLRAATSTGKQPAPARRSLGERLIRPFTPWRG